MAMQLTEYQAECLRNDAKTLVDISRMMEMEGRFKIIPNLLDGIATDILAAIDVKGSGKEVVG